MIPTKKPDLGLYPNWDVISPHIKCWADADGAMVYTIGELDVFALDAHEAVRLATSEDYNGELDDIRRKIRSLKNEIDDMEEQLWRLECKENDMRNEIRDAALKVKVVEPEWSKNHPRLENWREERARQKIRALSMSHQKDMELLSSLRRCYNRIGIPFTPQTVDLFIESPNKEEMVRRAEEWANSTK